MKYFFTTLLVSAVFLANAQTFSPAVFRETNNSFRYDFQQVQTGNTKETVFTIAGVPNGTTFELNLVEDLALIPPDDPAYCYSTDGDLNYSVASGLSGVVKDGKGNFTISYHPRQYYYSKAIFEEVCPWNCEPEFVRCEQTEYNELPERKATLYISLSTNVNNSVLDLVGTTAKTITSLEEASAVKTDPKTASFIKDVLRAEELTVIYDSFGKEVASGQGTLLLEHLKSGMYILKTPAKTQKIIKK